MNRTKKSAKVVVSNPAVATTPSVAEGGNHSEDKTAEVKAPANQEVLNIPLREIMFYLDQPRRWFHPQRLKELAESIAEKGQLVPGTVMRLKTPVDGYKYKLLGGERRLRACHMLHIPFRGVVDENVLDEADQYEKSVTENFHREDHPCTEIATAIQKLKGFGRTDEQISVIVGKTVQVVQQHYSLLKLDPEVFRMMEPDIPEDERLMFRIGKELVGVPPAFQLQLAKAICEQGLSVSKARQLIDKTLRKDGVRGSIEKPWREYRRFVAFVERTADELDRLGEIPFNDLRLIIRSGSLQNRMRVIEILEQIGRSFPNISDQVQTALKRSGAEKAKEEASSMARLRKVSHGFDQLREKIEKVCETLKRRN